MKKFILGILFTLFAFNTQANAGFYVDPYLSYFSGDYGNSAATIDLTGVSIGSRFGWQTLGLALGLEYATGDWELDTAAGTDGTPTQLGVFAAYEFPILLRVYGTYFFQDELDFDGSSTLEGSGIKLGVGYTGLPFISINFETLVSTYDEADGTPIPDIDVDGFLIGVSLPISL